MESPRERACPSCGAPATGPQRWCLECGHELSGSRRSGLRPAVGIATTLAVLVGAASAGAYTLLQDGKEPPPPAQTVAVAPPATTPPETLPPATQEPPPSTPAPAPSGSSGFPSGSSGGGSSSFGSGSSSSSPGSDFSSGGGGGTSGGGGGSSSGSGSGDGSVAEDPGGSTGTTASKPKLTLTNIALGAAAVVYAPYTPDDVDLGDPSRTVDGSTRTAWKAPRQADPEASPQIGVYVDLAGREQVRKLVLETPTPGMTVEIYGATRGPPDSITDAGWDHVASRSGIAAETKVKLPAHKFRYVLVWITEAPPDGARAAISELSLYSLQPE